MYDLDLDDYEYLQSIYLAGDGLSEDVEDEDEEDEF